MAASMTNWCNGHSQELISKKVFGAFIDLERQFAGMMQNPDITQGRMKIRFANMRGDMKQLYLGPSMEDLHYDWLMTFMLNLNLIDEDPCPLLVIDGTRNHGAYFPRLTPISEA